MYAQIKKFDEALQFLNKAVEIQPNNADAYNNLGGVLKELEDFKKINPYWDGFYLKGLKFLHIIMQ